MTGFKTGTRPVPQGVLEFAVTGLDLAAAPASVSVNIRQPGADADLITGYVVGTPTEDGFTVALSAEAAVGGYILDFTAFLGDTEIPIDGASLAVSYNDLKSVVAKFLGYDADNLTTGETAEVDGYIQSGVRNFYYPPKTIDAVDEHFEWSFIRQAGSVQTSVGVGDYSLPAGFGRIAGQITVAGDDLKAIPIVPYGDIMRMRTRGETGRPRFAAVTSARAFNSRGQVKKLHLYPTPDREFTLDFVCDSDTGRLDAEDNPFPLGGAMFAELITESCLAVAEQRANDEEGLHTKKFTELLVSMIARDRKSSAQSFGDIGDPEGRYPNGFIPLRTRGCLY